MSSPRRRRQPKRRVRRQRMPRQGMLIQMDGSHHPWLGDRMLPFTLLIAVDDATGTVVDALFCEKEDAHSYFLLIQRLISARSRPTIATTLTNEVRMTATVVPSGTSLVGRATSS